MLGPYEVHELHPNSLKEAQFLSFMWKDGLLTITYARHDTPEEDGPFYVAEWQVKCPEPKLVREQRHRSPWEAHLRTRSDQPGQGAFRRARGDHA